MKVKVTEEEWYPVLELDRENSDVYAVEVELPGELVLEYKRAMKKFNEVSYRLSKAYRKALGREE